MADKPINILETRELSRHYGGVIALSKVTMQIHPGQISSLIGPNGAGKTTLFNCVTGLDTPTLGNVNFLGKPITGYGPMRLHNSVSQGHFRIYDFLQNLLSWITSKSDGMHALTAIL